MEVEELKAKLAAASRGEMFLLQGGDCAERFQDCNQKAITAKMKILLQMSLVITYMGRVPLVRIARLAGQYAKPRSSPWETLPDGSKIPAFRGDIINGYDIANRKNDPNRLLQAYFHSATTLNYSRALMAGGFASLRHPDNWNLDFIKDPSILQEYTGVVDRILDSMNFFDTIGATTESNLSSVNLYTSHEGLLLDYEEAMTRKMHDHDIQKSNSSSSLDTMAASFTSGGNSTGKYYNLGAHYLWIGDRTREMDGAHIEYFSGIHNPIGIKVGPSMKPDELSEIIHRLNPFNEPGRITLITRFGQNAVETHLPSLIEAVQKGKYSVLWACDPMHGNTKLHGNLKTRAVAEISAEVVKSFKIHKEQGSILGGVHFEMTGENVTECIGGSQQLEPEELSLSYETYCDPRLNYTQSLDVAFLVAKQIALTRGRKV
jgi:3-deoxy-7-phosphoheptulonate synthase